MRRLGILLKACYTFSFFLPAKQQFSSYKMLSLKDNRKEISFINSSIAKAIDDNLMTSPNGFSIDQLMGK